ncbi:MAG: quinone-dependent dihydroorotate dehydrogenase [Anaerolineales bacterium]|jgi:dihydroorotate dehydrogenase
MTFYPRVLRPLLFRLEPERAHALTLRVLQLAGAVPGALVLLRAIYRAPDRPVRIFGLNFSNPIGLAAGYDKDGLAVGGLACLGFGHLEVGTVTPEPQAGNPRPRVFRLPSDQALINRMGFPNDGAEALLEGLRRHVRRDFILGVNIGKGMATPLEGAADDYLHLLDMFYDSADYLAVNVSSPNTIGLRRLQAREALNSLLRSLADARNARIESGSLRKPLLVKLAPDLNTAELDDALDAITGNGFDGVIATNTTVDRAGLRDARRVEGGGLSGAPLRARSTAMVRDIQRMTSGRLPIIATGGVFTAADVSEKLDAGAALVQLYTGLVYRGPGLVKSILVSLASG